MFSADRELSRALSVRAIEGGLLRLQWLAAATRFVAATGRLPALRLYSVSQQI